MALTKLVQKRLKVLADNGTPASIVEEMERRLEELGGLNKDTVQQGTTAPQLFSSVNSFVQNPSTVSVETFKRMIDTDETVGAGIDFLILCLIARFGEYKHPNKKIEAFVRKAIIEMDGSFHENLDEMFSAEWAGFSVTEIVWKFVKDFDGFSAWVPKKLVTYQPLTIAFAVDQSGEVLADGIFQYQRYYGQNNGYLANSLDDGFRPDFYAARGDFAHPIRIGTNLAYNVIQINRDKVVHLKSSSTGKFGNPYGRSILRRCYKSWVSKDAALKMWIIAMDRKASPLLVGYAPPNETVGYDGAGNVTRGIRADVALSMTLQNIRNESAVVLPGKKGENYDLETIQTQADMSVFKDHVEYDNKAIMRGLLIPPLILGGDGGGSFALGDAHRQIFQQVVDGKLKPYKSSIIDQLIRPMIQYNFGQDDWREGFGDFGVDEFDPDVMEKLSSIYQTLTTNGYMSPSNQMDMDLVTEKFNLPKRKAAVLSEMNPTADDGQSDPYGFNDSDSDEHAHVGTGESTSAKPQDQVLNGAQVSSLVDVVKSVNTGEISRQTAIQVIMTAFSVDEEKANKLLGPVHVVAQPTNAAPAEPKVD